MATESELKIKEDIIEIINNSKKNKGSCLCGRGEWCDVCDSFSEANQLIEKLLKYLDEIK